MIGRECPTFDERVHEKDLWTFILSNPLRVHIVNKLKLGLYYFFDFLGEISPMPYCQERLDPKQDSPRPLFCNTNSSKAE